MLPTSRWQQALLALVALHLAWGLGRAVPKVWFKRSAEIATYERQGAAGFFLASEHWSGSEAVEFLTRNTPPDSIVLWRGAWRGSLEFVPLLISPRLLVAAEACADDASDYHGRPIARGRLPDGREGEIVLVGLGDDLELTVR